MEIFGVHRQGIAVAPRPLDGGTSGLPLCSPFQCPGKQPQKPTFHPADATAPLNGYGRTKVAAENLLRDSRHLVVRIPIVYGRSPFSDRCFARFNGAKTPAQTDIVCAPLYLPSLPAALEQLWDYSGIVHFGGSEVTTRYALMTRIRDALNLPTEIVPVRNAALPSGRLRPSHLVLRSIRHSLTGPDVDTALADMIAATRLLG